MGGSLESHQPGCRTDRYTVICSGNLFGVWIPPSVVLCYPNHRRAKDTSAMIVQEVPFGTCTTKWVDIHTRDCDDTGIDLWREKCSQDSDVSPTLLKQNSKSKAKP